jgi:iron complex transport system substrate-binding protein
MKTTRGLREATGLFILRTEDVFMRRTALLIALVLAAGACGPAEGGDSTTSQASSTTTVDATTTTPQETTTTVASGFPVSVTDPNGEVTIEERPERIVSLSATATEILFAIGAGDQVVAVDETSDYPEDAPTTELSGYEPNIEAIAEYEPDLVVVSDDLGDVIAGLEAIEIAVIQQPVARTLDDTYAQIEQLGAATGHVAEAAGVVSDIQIGIDDVLASIQAPPGASFYHELDNSFFSVTSETFIGLIYSLAGLVNIADEAEGAGTGYPQLSAEYIIDSDPDLIFLADTECCGESPETVAARSGWGQLTAVSNDSVIALDDDIASRWGPRVVDLLAVIVDSVNALDTSGS